jgi:hypothetical protein
MSIEADLATEIKKWSKRLDDSLLNVQPSGKRGAKMLQNIMAYRNDSKHFLGRGDLIKSFECLIWAWAILNLGKELELFRTGPLRNAK